MRRARILEVISNIHENTKGNYKNIILIISMIGVAGILAMYKKKKVKSN